MEQNDKIIELIQNGYECDYLDFKAKQYNKENYSDMIKDIMAMANSHVQRDKYIIVGVKHKPNGGKDIIGILEEEFVDVSVYQQIVMENIEPEIKFEYIPFEYQGKLIGILKVFGGNKEKPYMMKKQNKWLHIGQCYIRKGANNTNAVRKDFDAFYSLGEKFELKIMQPILAAVYSDLGCAAITVTMRNYTKLPLVIIAGQLNVFNNNGQQLSQHNVYGFENKIGGADFKLAFMPMEEKCGEICVGFSSTDCLNLGLDEDGFTNEKFVFELNLYDTNENEYNTTVENGLIFAKGDFLWKVQLKAQKEDKNNFSFKRIFKK